MGAGIDAVGGRAGMLRRAALAAMLAVAACMAGLALMMAAGGQEAWAADYTLTFKTNGGTWTDGPNKGTGNDYRATKKDGKNYNLEYSVHRDGYILVGWKSSTGNGSQKDDGQGGTFQGYNAHAEVRANKDQTLTAVWKPGVTVRMYAPAVDTTLTATLDDKAGNTYGNAKLPCNVPANDVIYDRTVSYDNKSFSTEGSGLPNYNGRRTGSPAMYSLFKDGYRATSWVEVGRRGSGEYLSCGQGFPTAADLAQACGFNDTSKGAVINLYCIMQKADHVRLDANGGTNSALKSSNEGKNYTVSASADDVQLFGNQGDWSGIGFLNPSRTGYTFQGWYDAADGGTKVYNADGLCANDGTWWAGGRWVKPGGGDAQAAERAAGGGKYTLYAHWALNTYTVAYDANGGALTGTAKTQYTVEDDDWTLPSPVRAGWTFAGWTGSNGSTPQTSVTVKKGTTGNLQYKANWTRNENKVTYHANGGTGTIAPTSTPTAVKTKLATGGYEKNGSILAGWNTQADGKGESYTLGEWVKVDKSMDLYAVWADANAFVNTWDPYGGLSVDKTDVDGNGLADAEFAIVRSGEDTLDDALKWVDVAKKAEGKESYDITSDLAALKDTQVPVCKSITTDTTGHAETAKDALPCGWYAVIEVRAPGNHVIGDGTTPAAYAVQLTEPDTIVSAGFQDATPVTMVVRDKQKDGDYSGAQVKKTDDSGKPLAGATFSFYNESEIKQAIADYPSHKDDTDDFSNQLYSDATDYALKTVRPVATAKSGADGIAKTNDTAFGLSQGVWCVETAAPAGYRISPYSFETGDGVVKVASGSTPKGYNDLTDDLTVKDSDITPVPLQLEATKSMENGDLEYGRYSFQLLDASGNVLQTKTNGVTEQEQTNFKVMDNDSAVSSIQWQYRNTEMKKSIDSGLEKWYTDKSSGRYKVDKWHFTYGVLWVTLADRDSSETYDDQWRLDSRGNLAKGAGETDLDSRGGDTITLDHGKLGSVEVETTADKRAWRATNGTWADIWGAEDGCVVMGSIEKAGSPLELGEAEFDMKTTSEARDVQDPARVLFDPITYTKADLGRTYTYKVREVAAVGNDGIVYDAHTATAKVTVTDTDEDGDRDGALHATVKWVGGDDEPVFHNSEKTGQAVLEAHKALTTRSGEKDIELSGDEFEFAVSDAETGEPVQTTPDGPEDEPEDLTAANDAYGDAEFAPIEYTKDDIGHTYHYAITEKVPADADKRKGVAYTSKPVLATVTVADDGGKDLDVRVSYDSTAEDSDGRPAAKMTNTYGASGQVVLGATKRLIDQDGNALEIPNGRFAFEVIDDNTGERLATGAADAKGDVSFSPIEYDEDDIGEHDYVIRETGTDAGGYDYDMHECKAVVDVTDNGDGTLTAKASYPDGNRTFTNVQASVEMPFTGMGGAAVPAGLVLAAVAAACAWKLRKTRRETAQGGDEDAE